MKVKCPYCGHAIAQTGGLTQRQADMLKWLRNYDWSSGVSPSYAEICKGTDFVSKSGAHRVISALAERGFLTFTKHRNRSIRLVKWEQDDGKTAERPTNQANLPANSPDTDQEQ